MQIIITRRWLGENSTLSTVTIDGKPHHFILEDKDRGLRPDMSADEIKALKVPGKTAIPTGSYQVLITYSNRFKRSLPILKDVPGFSGIRIHAGNQHIHTEGCLLPGRTWWPDGNEFVVGNSRRASEQLQTAITEAISQGQTVWLTVQTDYPV
ncbi:hypothetical protein DYBT9275_00921 [Dyadobacter sp. CECT 9275]|uniref:DUF5675 domain-containing protein n=1 Tax=Dyadobacter helix TaxID=2822344 RepID=A0A916N2Y1_9BACT|nr:DUF5675 family protein [Dyadobacter sp. CECT 9275]CAG4992238.1 hypothetical protein DYBT9275_00921 [Dyadobacter sp. CECT 9275]